MDVSNLPKRLIICGVPFTVRYRDKLDGDGDEIVYGQTYGHGKLIEISLAAHSSEAQIRSTLLHESLHAILHVTGHSEGLSDEKEEGIVIALENALGEIVGQLGRWSCGKKKA